MLADWLNALGRNRVGLPIHARPDQLRIQPFDHGRITQAFRIVTEIVWNDGENVKAFLKLKAKRGIVFHTFDNFRDVLLRL